MSWWAWVIGGAILLGAELAFVDAQFYLVFVGTAAIVVGLASAALPTSSDGIQWAVFALLCVVSMVGFRSRVYDRLRGHPPGVATGPVGSVLVLPEALAAGASCQVEHGGTWWTVRNDSAAALAQGTRVRVARVEALVLSVHPESAAH